MWITTINPYAQFSVSLVLRAYATDGVEHYTIGDIQEYLL